MTEKNSEIKVRNVSKSFYTGKDKKLLKVLENINFSVFKGEFFCIIGPSGCGKTTLLNLLGGFEKPTKGKILVESKEVNEPQKKYFTLFQDYALFPWKTVLQNVCFGLEESGLKKEEIILTSRKFIELVGLKDFENNYPHQLSGGMKRRVSIARALAMKPSVLFMDEPFAGLDMFTRLKMEEELKNINKKTKITIVFITHDIDSAIFLGNRIALMQPRPGKIKKIINNKNVKSMKRSSKEFFNLKTKILDEFKNC